MLNSIKVCVLGCGASGILVSERILSRFNNLKINIDLYERTKSLYGLVKYGVAPDHVTIKSNIKRYERFITQNIGRNINIVLNTNILEKSNITTLLNFYNIIIFATGGNNNNLNINNNNLNGITFGHNIVNWYNNNPLFNNKCPIDLNNNRINLIGNGNASLDIARILLNSSNNNINNNIKKNYQKYFDGSIYNQLCTNKIKEVHIYARKSPYQVAFTMPSLLELHRTPDTNIIFDDIDFENSMNDKNIELLKGNKEIKSLSDLYDSIRNKKTSPDNKSIYFHFLHTPSEFLSEDNKILKGILFNRTSLVNNDVVPTPIEINNMILSLGYNSSVKHNNGRLIGHDNCYCVGWAKNNGKGDLGETIRSSTSTVDLIENDLKNNNIPQLSRDITQLDLLKEFNITDYMTYKDYLERNI